MRDVRDLSFRINLIFSDAETKILKEVSKLVDKTVDRDDLEFIINRGSKELRPIIQKIIDEAYKEALNEVSVQMYKAYEEGAKLADKDREYLSTKLDKISTKKPVLTKVERSIEGQKILDSTLDKIKTATKLFTRSSYKVYNRVIRETLVGTLEGKELRRASAQKALNRYASRGISTFVDKGGRSWDIASYTEMATRTGLIQTRVQGHVDRIREHGGDLVRVSEHSDTCPKCEPWQGKILSLSGSTKGYPTLDEAISAGLFHPNCSHRIHEYIEGYSNTEFEYLMPYDPDRYENRQKQRYMERQIRKWKRIESVAITEADKKRATAKVREWQDKLREHTREKGLRRDYTREQINKAR